MVRTKERIPAVQEARMERQIYQSLICSRIGFTEEDYNTLQYLAALFFVEATTYPQEKESIEYSREFWGWWRLHWYKRDVASYRLPELTPDQYIDLNTTELLTNSELLNNFLFRIDSMLAEGEKNRKEKA